MAKEEKIKKIEFKFTCSLMNKNGYEESFDVLIKSIGLATAKDELDKILEKYWGFIPRRYYRNEDMKSERYWSVELKVIKVL